jgi:hypothetical protein
MTTRFRRWLADWLRSSRRRPPEFSTRAVTEWPREPLPNVLYRLGDNECEWAAGLKCPCGCGAFIQLSLVEDASPSWRIDRKRSGEFTLMPSVWRTVSCRSHFIIYRSRILWCHPADPGTTEVGGLNPWRGRLAKSSRNS